MIVLVADVIQICAIPAEHLLPISCDSADIGGDQEREPPQHCGEHFDDSIAN